MTKFGGTDLATIYSLSTLRLQAFSPGSIAVSEAAVKSHVFVSYSRKDTAFANHLEAALKACGFNAYIDRKDILPGEPWKERLGGLIAAADTVVFLLSPDSTKSEICAWEVDEAERLAKRVLPAVYRPVAAADVPGRLARLNWIDFSEVASFDAALGSLEQALLTDIAWLRELTRLVGLAEHWERGGRQPTQLMSQADIKATEQLLATRPQSAKLPPQSLRDFFETSRARLEEDIRRLRRTTGRAFVKPALQALDEGNHEHALRLAATGAILAEDLDLELVRELRAPAKRAISGLRVRAILAGHKGSVGIAIFSPDSRYVVTTSEDRNARQWNPADGEPIIIARSDNTARVWEVDNGSMIANLVGHGGSLRCAMWSPSGKRVVTGSNDGTARVWDPNCGREVVTLRGHLAPVISVAWSSDGLHIVTASEDATTRVWDTGSGQEMACFAGRVDSAAWSPDNRLVVAAYGAYVLVYALDSGREIARLKEDQEASARVRSKSAAQVKSTAWSPDGSRIVTPWGNEVLVWDPYTGCELVRFAGHASGVESAAWSPDGHRIVTASWDHTARVWDADSGREITRLDGHERSVNSATWCPNGRRIVTASEDCTARVWDADSGSEIARLSGHEDRVQCATWSPDGRLIVSASEDATARVWSSHGQSEIVRLVGHTGSVDSVAWCSNGQRIVTASDDHTARVWDANSGHESACLTGHERPVEGAVWSPDGQHIVTVSRDCTARVWDANDGRAIACFKGHEGDVVNAEWSPNGRRIVTASGDCTARVWDAHTGREIAYLSGHQDRVMSARWSSDGRHIVTASEDNTAMVWNAEDGAALFALIGHCGAISAAAFSPDGTRVVTASDDYTARVWDAHSGREIACLNHGNSEMGSTVFTGDAAGAFVWDAAWSPDGLHIVTASHDHTARVWEADTGRETARLIGHATQVRRAVWSPDGSRIATASNDNTARVWDTDGGEIACLEGHGQIVPSVAWSPNGQRVVTASFDHTARVWDVSRTESMIHDRTVVLTAALARGIGWRTDAEAADLLMQDAPEDLYAAARQKLFDPAKYSKEEIAHRERALQEIIAVMHAPRHPNCYLSPTQFAEKFGLPVPSA